jgi:hypothetical protein
MFGLQIQDVVMQELIASHGLTVTEALRLDKAGGLPKKVADALANYRVWLKELEDNQDDGTASSRPPVYL